MAVRPKRVWSALLLTVATACLGAPPSKPAARGESVRGADVSGTAPKLTALEQGLIAKGPFLFVGDDIGMLHLLDEDVPLINRIGVYSGFDGGYTKPDQLAKQSTERGAGTMSYKGKVHGRDVTFSHTMSIEGERIRLRLERTGTWSSKDWVQLRIPLPITRYGGASYRADGRVHVYPKDYAERQSLPTGVRRFETHTENSRLNIVLESEAGFTLFDQRRYKDPYYLVQVDLPTGAQTSVDVFITLPDVPGYEPHAAVRFSRIGYPAAAEKVAILEWPKHAARPADGVRLERKDGSVAFAGKFGETETLSYVQNAAATFDFSSVREPGEYRVVWQRGATEWFPIKPSVFIDRLWHPTLDSFIPFEMCHADVDLGPDVIGHGLCHADDAVRAPANHHGPDAFISYEAKGTPYGPREHVPLGIGGWHDAGDFDVNVPAQAFVVWTLALAFEEFGLTRDVATLDVPKRKFTAGKPDGVPDILQQVEWGARWLLSVQQKDGRVYNGVCAELPQRAGRPVDKITDGVPGTGDERLLYVDYHSDQQLNYVIGMAAAARALKATNANLADQCLKASKLAFSYFQKNPEVYRKGSYTAPDVKGKERDGAVIAAAIELYLATSDAGYLREVEKLAPSLEELKFEWPLPRWTSPGPFPYAPSFLARLVPKLQSGPLKDSLIATCRRAAQVVVKDVSVRPWPIYTWDMGEWGNNGILLARVFDTYYMTRVVPDALPPEKTLRGMYWLFGLRPTTDKVFVQGLGLPATEHLYSTHLHETVGYGPKSIPGAVTPGMGGFWFSNVVAHIDEHGYYGHNEACIYTQAAYIFAMNAMKKFGY
jgi:hypothetical protein